MLDLRPIRSLAVSTGPHPSHPAPPKVTEPSSAQRSSCSPSSPRTWRSSSSRASTASSSPATRSAPRRSTVGGVLPGVDDEGKSGSKEPINILVLGLDRRPRDGETPTPHRHDLRRHVDPKTKSTGILGIPRDLLVRYPARTARHVRGPHQHGVRRRRAERSIERRHRPAEGGHRKTTSTSRSTSTSSSTSRASRSIIDALGGIDVDVPDEVYDPYYSETELPGDYLPQHFYPGTQHMDGRTALAYSRIRFSSDDLDRIQRQQRVIFAAIDKAKSTRRAHERAVALGQVQRHDRDRHQRLR